MAVTETFLTGSILITFRDVVTMPLVAFILLSIFFLGLIYQVFSENINVVGVLSIASIIIFYSGHLLIGDYNGIALVLFVFGIALIIMEFFVIGAILGIIGSILLLFSILLVSDSMAVYSLFLLGIILLALIEWVIFVKYKKRKIPILSRLILNDSTDAESGYTSFDDRSYLLGETAMTMTPLRPSGTIRYGDQRIDAVAEGSYIAGNVEVKVIHVEGTRVVVRPKED
ncbi:serine protease [Salinicoccus sp. ID82-1]|uniref:Serine protease n=1 Tax=Salinicoccus cyprini TaxID=2493691 RepID=A0A558AYQ5_9STAP|nr:MULTISPECIES: NfeD family protein [Salinicoccus]MCG1008916.1 serine protease [Salinicoccus sp. ID82-1]TVT29377.1 serine protease [Salinicoccus cyprini]